MKKITRYGSLIGALAVAAIPAVTAVSCATSFILADLDYDFGLTASPINNLNYIKNSSKMRQVLPLLFSGISKSGPSGSVKNIVKPSNFQYSQVVPTGSNYIISGISYPLSDYSIYAGNAKALDKGLFYVQNTSNPELISELIVSLDGFQRWKGASDKKYNRVITAQDYIDGMKYIIDINNGSDGLLEVRNLKIAGVEELFQAQTNYFRNIGKTYSNPLGWGLTAADGLLNENPGDEVYVDAIDLALKTFNRVGMRTFNGVVGSNSANSADTTFIVGFDKNSTTTVLDILDSGLSSLIAANREFVESVGGIHQFGTSFEKTLYTGPFNISKILLGQGGYINLEKDDSFLTATETIPRKIKIYFQDDPNVISSMYNDGYISYAQISSTYQLKFWADEKTRQFMNKSRGFGTVALQLNLDKETNGNSPLQDEDFRNAISYGIDREKLLRLAGWDSSVPVTTWTVLSQAKNSRGRHIDSYFTDQKFKTPFSEKEHQIATVDYIEHLGSNYTFESIDRTDPRHDPEIAKQYLDRYIKKTNSRGETLKFIAGDPSNVNVAIGIQSLLKETFGNFIKIDIQNLPENTYENFRTQGNFDLTSNNFDTYGSKPESYIKRLVGTDEIDTKTNKVNGFIENPTGSWTYNTWYEDNKDNLVDVKNRLLVNDWVWEEFLKLAKMDPKSSDTTEYSDSIWALRNPNIDTYDKLFEFIILLEKVIALSSPIIPMLEVDNFWEISRIAGASGLYKFDLQYGYDVFKKPSPVLPGKEEIT